MRTILTDEELIAWGWRIPFLSGILIAFVAIYLHTHGKEHNPNSSHYDDDNDEFLSGEEVKHPLSEVFKKENLPALGSATLTPMLWGAGFYTSECYFNAVVSIKLWSLSLVFINSMNIIISFLIFTTSIIFSICMDGNIYGSVD